MGWYFRRSQKLGPVRINFSRSGVGASVGMKGFRIGVSGRGQPYVHAGRGGFYYRSNLGTVPSPTQTIPGISPEAYVGATATAGPMVAHGSAQQNVRMDDVVEAIQTAASTTAMMPFVVGATLISLVAIWFGLEEPTRWWLLLPTILAGGLAIYFATERDNSRILSLDFELDDIARPQWTAFCDAVDAIARTTSLVMRGGAEVYNSKYHAGAGTLVDTKPLSVYRNRPINFVKSSSDVPAIEPIPGTTYHFLPDRIIFVNGQFVGSIDYSELKLDGGTTNIIQDVAPRDARVIGHTWRYTNKDGRPDRRFNCNPELPIVLYHLLRITTNGGMDHALLFSDRAVASRFAETLAKLAELKDVALTPLALLPLHRDEDIVRDRGSEVRQLDQREIAADIQGGDAETFDSPNEPTVFEIVLGALCCMMFADGRASKDERRRVHDLMKQIRSPWTEIEVEERMRSFCTSVRNRGFDTIFDEMEKLAGRITDRRQQKALLQCLKHVAKVDGNVTDVERSVLTRFTNVFELH